MATTKWVLDPSHSELGFKVKHLMVTNVSGSFNNFSVTAETSGDDFANAVVTFSADTTSISTNSEQRDEHLKSADFFDAANFPAITFKATAFEKKGSGEEYELTGDLTIKDVTKTVEFDVVYNGTVKDPWGNTKAGFKLTGSINRVDYGIKWNVALEAGGVLVSEEVKIVCDIEIAKAK